MLPWLSNFALDLRKSQEPYNPDHSRTNIANHEVCWSYSITVDHLLNVSLLRSRSPFWGSCPHPYQSIFTPLFLSIHLPPPQGLYSVNIRITSPPIKNSFVLHLKSIDFSFNKWQVILNSYSSVLKNLASLPRNFALCPKYLSLPRQLPLLWEMLLCQAALPLNQTTFCACLYLSK